MNGHWIVAAGLVWVVAGCQSSQQSTTLPPGGSAAPSRVEQKSAPEPTVDPHVADVIRQADAQAKAIEQLPVTRITDPKKPATASSAPGGASEAPKIIDLPSPTPVPSKSPGVGAVESAIAGMPVAKPVKPADDGFRPVPAIVGPDGKPFQATITPPAGTPGPTPTPPETVAANTPTPGEPIPAEPTPQGVIKPPPAAGDMLGQQLAQKARQYPRDLGPQLEDQIYRLLNDERVPSTEAMAGLSLEDRDILSSVLDGLANFRGSLKKDANLLVTRKIQPLLEMSERLRTRADMSITNANVCRKIVGFGIYDAIIPATLRAGAANKVSLYYEVENLNPRLDGNNNWVTPFQQDLVLYDEFGQPQWSKLGQKSKDECRTRRRDFFLNTPIEFPATLKPGRYMLKITFTEANARVAEQSVPINFTATAPTNNLAPGPQGPVFGGR